ncbi:hypothetical protein VKA52_17425 [Halobacillus sp. HZG1]|uniref:hypothetical protein n=1 Tax=Halobacillus sp. HZG1 TaxID=3111769 RepID=UPI002DB5E13B|nr:hypothetical protein [Halobacillus sp. HZG1]MEC3885503.1 hypothetical protein [Halobacillus sp. HZG1]
MTRTSKSDWLNDWLAQMNNMYVSGHESFRKRLNLPDNSVVTIRYINLRGRYIWILTVESIEEDWSAIKTSLTNNQDFNLINEKFGKELNILLFSPTNPNIFSYKIFDRNYIDVDSNGLIMAFNSQLPNINQNPGTVKNRNKSLNDNFQLWTRSKLSKYSVINDFDAVFLNNGSGKDDYIYELKRVRENMDSWEPYTDELRNYERVNKISGMLSFNNMILAYNFDNPNHFAAHYNVNPQNSAIKGTKSVFSVLENSYIDKPKNYVSTRKRQR